MGSKRLDSAGRDVTDLPGLWSEEDVILEARMSCEDEIREREQKATKGAVEGVRVWVLYFR